MCLAKIHAARDQKKYSIESVENMSDCFTKPMMNHRTCTKRAQFNRHIKWHKIQARYKKMAQNREYRENVNKAVERAEQRR